MSTRWQQDNPNPTLQQMTVSKTLPQNTFPSQTQDLVQLSKLNAGLKRYCSAPVCKQDNNQEEGRHTNPDYLSVLALHRQV